MQVSTTYNVCNNWPSCNLLGKNACIFLDVSLNCQWLFQGQVLSQCTQYIFQDSKDLYSLIYLNNRFLAGWSGLEIKRTVHLICPNGQRPMNKFKLNEQSRQQALRISCPKICTVLVQYIQQYVVLSCSWPKKNIMKM